MIKGLGLVMSFAVLFNLAASPVRTPQESKAYQQFDFAVPGITLPMLYADFWINRLPDAEKVIMDWPDIVKYNQLTYEKAPTMVNLAAYPDTLDRDMVVKAITEVCSIPQSPRYYHNGSKLTAEDYRHYLNNANAAGVPEQVAVKYGLAVKRDLLRKFPSSDRACNAGRDLEVDMFVETAIYPGEAVAILHTSLDGQWYLVQKYNYLAWAAAETIAVGGKKEVVTYGDTEDFLVVTGPKVRTGYDPINPAVSEREFDMACRLPLSSDADYYTVDRQGTDFAFKVILPVRNADGTLSFAPALISRAADVNVGFLPFSRANILRQAFKFMGERYGWGDDNNARDCSGFILSVYSTFGLLVPRNGGEQELDSIGVHYSMNGQDNDRRVALLKQMKVGDTISSPTHIMMYVGECDGELYMIHDHIGSGYNVNGEYLGVESRCVGVTPILSYMVTNGKRHYYEAFSGIKRLVLPEKDL